ncbi:MAG: sigma-70 family RNA polymerase sigma factor [Gemmataceae bacterium]
MPDPADPLADSGETLALLGHAERGDPFALGELLARHRRELRAFVENHLDPQLQARFDPSDVVQDAQLEAAKRLQGYLARRPMPFRVWLRKTAYERLQNLQRDHTRQKRSVHREQPLPDRSSLLIAGPLVRPAETPTEQVAARETAEKVSRAVGRLSREDREVLMMRHGENLPYEEIACLLDIEAAAARQRYGRALIRLQRELAREGVVR